MEGNYRQFNRFGPAPKKKKEKKRKEREEIKVPCGFASQVTS
jgi:hypothetical protein